MDQKDYCKISNVNSREEFEKLLSHIKETGFPALRSNIARIRFSGNDQQVTIIQLARQILRDPGLSAKMLKIANSPFFNPGLYRVRTITRAIVLLGLRNVSTLLRSIAFLEDVVNCKELEKAIEQILTALRKAELAKHLAEATGSSSPEEIFVGALMHNIGEIVFASFVSPELNAQIEKISKEQNLSKSQVQRKILGFSPEDITATLNKEWKLSPVLDELFSKGAKSKSCKLILYADKVIELTESKDVPKDPSKVQDVLKDMSTDLGITPKTAIECIKSAKEDFQRLEKTYSQHFQTLHKASKRDDENDLKSPEALTAPEDQSHVSSEKVLEIFDYLQDIISMLFKGFNDPHLLFSLIMEAIYSGLEMDVTFFGLLSTDRKCFKIRHNLTRPGINNVNIPEIITFKNPRMNLFVELLNTEEAFWINEKSSPELLAKAKSIPASGIIHIPCFLMPVRPQNKTIGFIYADSRSKDNHLNESTFSIFTMLGKLATIGLSFLTTDAK